MKLSWKNIPVLLVFLSPGKFIFLIFSLEKIHLFDYIHFFLLEKCVLIEKLYQKTMDPPPSCVLQISLLKYLNSVSFSFFVAVSPDTFDICVVVH